jgi:hypothetical protein
MQRAGCCYRAWLLLPQARDDNSCLRLSGGDEFQAALLGPAAGGAATNWVPASRRCCLDHHAALNSGTTAARELKA